MPPSTQIPSGAASVAMLTATQTMPLSAETHVDPNVPIVSAIPPIASIPPISNIPPIVSAQPVASLPFSNDSSIMVSAPFVTSEPIQSVPAMSNAPAVATVPALVTGSQIATLPVAASAATKILPAPVGGLPSRVSAALPSPEDDLDPSLIMLASQNRVKNRSKRSPEWIFFADAGMWQTMNGDESKFRIANCRYCLKEGVETKIRGKIETMKNHIMECDKIPASQKSVYERHPARYRKRSSTNGPSSADSAKRLKFDGLLKANTMSAMDGVENRAVVLHSAGDLRIDKQPIPVIPPGHLLIAVRSVGICGSDVHYWMHGRIGDFVVQKPMVLGHEASGVVRLVGEGVQGFEEGDRVALEPGIPCGRCPVCKEGRYNLCPDIKFAATPPVDGSLAHFIAHPAAFCFKLPSMVSFDEAALFEPLSVGIHACRRGNVSLGHRVLITGAGPIGIICMLVAKSCGASEVIIHDIDPERLQVAKELGAHRVDVSSTEADPKVVSSGIDADVCIDATGAESAIKTCIYGAKRGGVVVVVGMGKSDISYPVLDASIREVDLRGVFRYCNTYPTALQLVSSGKVQLKRLVTHRFKMVDAEEAFSTARDRDSKSIKVIIDCGPPPPPPLAVATQ